ncbi:type I-C CRISPR-associated protein Cas8c/Csd1 [Shinella sp. 838]|jgi:CRISPR-associated protein Csd1|uniref:type I-C CRISPR-associated protein Cas8c/Csd1 n=1 Tax=unclassified Shinella TaxID=2643062 RepID=UPI0003C54D52|nr:MULTISPECIES: type I-C CRISPR-associated protein Cas8c/Csd1 [unclassified Shinella]EYR78101.1 CRISPR-associated protein, Csd1 family [Shinella sp. DD12]MCA0344277.1 type I-C CRISPR-associated protein Cas8c/Csd1 [Pseudomonadota bacterium]MDG4672733.1 type I-C CRISPR-associated protein Cas8c/Csd1 [Shinella sp. 838]
MNILSSLMAAYERLPDAPPFGYSTEKVGVVVGLNEDGTVATVTPWLEGEGRKRKPRPMLVPQAVKRTAGIAPNFLWDKTAYVLGVTAGEGKRTAEEHRAFVERHLADIGDSEDVGLRALKRFLEAWTPDQFAEPLWTDELKDQNVVFALESERRSGTNLHDRPAAKALWNRAAGAAGDAAEICLVTGEPGPVARLHPSIKGVWGAQSSGAALVSFNLDAFTSYGREQGANAPVSEAAAFAYTTMLNRFLERDSGHRLQIGDASTVFWADASGRGAEEAEALFAAYLDDVGDARAEEKISAEHIRGQLARIRAGDHLEDIEPDLADGVDFYVLGLAPNAARLSVRFSYAGSFGDITRNYQKFVSDMRIEPPPRDGYPPLWRYLLETAVLGKRENVSPNLAGDWMRAILSGTPYPLSLMASVLTRIRADGEVNALRVGILKALLIRNFKKEATPVALDPANTNRGYVLGRLFALYEEIQRAALGGRVNATIKDKFYGSASATPRKVFAVLDGGSANHLAKIRKLNIGREVNLQRQLQALMDLMSPSDDPALDPFPVSLTAQEQAYFGLGYHHQRSDFFKKASETASAGETEA